MNPTERAAIGAGFKNLQEFHETMDTLEQAAIALGFESLQEFNKLTSDVDLSTHENLTAFKRWQSNDGSKAGLLKLPFHPLATR